MMPEPEEAELLRVRTDNARLSMRVCELERRLVDKQSMLDALQSAVLLAEPIVSPPRSPVSRKNWRTRDVRFGPRVRYMSVTANDGSLTIRTPMASSTRPDFRRAFWLVFDQGTAEEATFCERMQRLQQMAANEGQAAQGDADAVYVPFLVHGSSGSDVRMRVHCDSDDVDSFDDESSHRWQLECRGVVWWRNDRRYGLYWTARRSS